MSEKRTATRYRDAKKVCMVRFGAFGDIVMFSNHLRAVNRYVFPNARIDFVVAKEFAPLLEGADFVDRVIGHDRSGNFVQFIKFCRMLRSEKYDIYIDLHNNQRSNLMGTIAAARERHIIIPNEDPEGMEAALKKKPPVLKGIDLPGERTPVWLSQSDRDFIIELQKEIGMPAIGLCIVGSWESKRWPASRFKELAKKIVDEMGAKILLIGGPSDIDIATDVEKSLAPGSAANLAGKTSLSRSMAATLICSAIVSGDSGMFHAAHYSGVPCVGLFGCTDYKQYGHDGPKSVSITANLECSPCHKPICPLGTMACMEAISAERVYNELKEMIRKDSPRRAD